MDGKEMTTGERALENEVRQIIEQGRKAYAEAGQAAITTFWSIGRRIGRYCTKSCRILHGHIYAVFY